MKTWITLAVVVVIGLVFFISVLRMSPFIFALLIGAALGATGMVVLRR